MIKLLHLFPVKHPVLNSLPKSLNLALKKLRNFVRSSGLILHVTSERMSNVNKASSRVTVSVNHTIVCLLDFPFLIK